MSRRISARTKRNVAVKRRNTKRRNTKRRNTKRRNTNNCNRNMNHKKTRNYLGGSNQSIPALTNIDFVIEAIDKSTPWKELTAPWQSWLIRKLVSQSEWESLIKHYKDYTLTLTDAETVVRILNSHSRND